MPDTIPKTLLEAARYFSDLDRCNEYMAEIKWPSGKIVCPKCSYDNCAPVKSRPKLQCNKCRCQFSYKVGTIFEDSPLGLDKWFVALWSIANCKNGISSHELGRAIGVTQRTAWFMLQRIRKAMESNTFHKLNGEVESDESYIGGLAENMHAKKRAKKITGRGGADKTAVQAIRQRDGDVRTFVVKDTDAETLRGNIYRNVAPDSHVYTDSAAAYVGMDSSYRHSSVDHQIGYVKARTHTNCVENFWSLLKRTLKGTYVAVAPYHLHRYCHEQEWRFNSRTWNDARRFLSLLRGVLGKRLTYRELAAVGDAGFMTIK